MDKSQKKKKEEILMNSEKYEQLKEAIIGLTHDELINLFEIVIDELNARKLDASAFELRNKKDNEA